MTQRTRPRIAFLGILGEPGRYDPSVYDTIPGGDDEVIWFRDMLTDVGLIDGSDIDLTGYHICRGVAPPPPDSADMFIIGGSYHSVHDGRPWQQDLIAWLKDFPRGNNAPPVFGICGGHQMMSVATGGVVLKLGRSYVAGSEGIALTDAGRDHLLFNGFDTDDLVFHFANEDHVVDAPAGATVLASHESIPNAALDYGFGWVSVQFHPESTREVLAESWRPLDPAKVEAYRDLPKATRMVRNFIEQGAPSI